MLSKIFPNIRFGLFILNVGDSIVSGGSRSICANNEYGIKTTKKNTGKKYFIKKLFAHMNATNYKKNGPERVNKSDPEKVQQNCVK